MNERLNLDVWLDGVAFPAGSLIAYDDNTVLFKYTDDYLEAGAPPISLSLPLKREPHGDSFTRAFFGNLLPENSQIQRIREREGLEANDVAGILFHMGADCPGAISVLPAGQPPIKVPGNLLEDYVALSQKEIEDIMVSLADHERLPDDTDDPSPLAGVQSKMAITVLPDGSWALPRQGVKAPTTHILKVPSRADAGDVQLEAAACCLAHEIGLKASVPAPVSIAGRQGLLITRFDRRIKKGVVYRIHQEDFTQGLGLPASLKYQRKGNPDRRFDAQAIGTVLQQTLSPAVSVEAFLLATIFNLVVGNSDNHGKNHGLLYDSGRAPNLAPLYDIVPIRMSNRYTHELAFSIGEAISAANVTPEDFIAFCQTFGMTRAGAKRFIERQVRHLLERIEKASENLPRELKPFDDFIGQELVHISAALGLNLGIRERDYFAPQGGGWAPS